MDYNYGPEGELLSTSGDTAETATTQYDALYRVGKLTDGRGNVTVYKYNILGNLESVTYPGNDGDKTEYLAYDRLGRPLTVRDGKGQTTEYYYEGSEWELTSIGYPPTNPYPGYTSYGRNTVTIEYDVLGHVGSVTDAFPNASIPTLGPRSCCTWIPSTPLGHLDRVTSITPTAIAKRWN